MASSHWPSRISWRRNSSSSEYWWLMMPVSRSKSSIAMFSSLLARNSRISLIMSFSAMFTAIFIEWCGGGGGCGCC
ncbi:hypothetical protein BpHYR1_033705 [Brachionus plicatilis]|uniref:Uncharacterized protein n=1 Tax=Brachionus plicatilis TaxID=10195 RepID=A0A3M7SKD5_BRAPC|nr:hypothetical protein BpHYR1_033705 [Brachionus plicatilis]